MEGFLLFWITLSLTESHLVRARQKKKRGAPERKVTTTILFSMAWQVFPSRRARAEEEKERDLGRENRCGSSKEKRDHWVETAAGRY